MRIVLAFEASRPHTWRNARAHADRRDRYSMKLSVESWCCESGRNSMTPTAHNPMSALTVEWGLSMAYSVWESRFFVKIRVHH
jgi:hypothetical protein